MRHHRFRDVVIYRELQKIDESITSRLNVRLVYRKRNCEQSLSTLACGIN